MKYYLAIDIGASSGRHMLMSKQDDGSLVLEEIYRFENGITRRGGHLCWNHDTLFLHILEGMKRCKIAGKIPESVGIDTWGVDFVLLDPSDNVLGDYVSYRDERTVDMDEEVYRFIDEGSLYKRTGTLKAVYNTIYQLMAIKKNDGDLLNKAQSLLFTPDYFHFLLSGVKVNEYSIASTSQLLNPVTRDWDRDLIDLLGFPGDIFRDIKMPGTCIGCLRSDIEDIVGFNCKVVLPAAHDTQSAILSVPYLSDKCAYISSGTWSLMGVELDEANTGDAAKKYNFTNEGGYGGKYTFLSNIMGLWMIQEAKRESAPDMSYAKLCEEAALCDIKSLVNPLDDRFLAPSSMTQEITSYCRETGQKVPSGIFETACVIYNSLAKCYSDTLRSISEITGIKYDRINIVGGGSNADYLNRLTSSFTGIKVYAGPSEATAIGNCMIQMLSAGEYADVYEARKAIRDSFEIKEY